MCVSVVIKELYIAINLHESHERYVHYVEYCSFCVFRKLFV